MSSVPRACLLAVVLGIGWATTAISDACAPVSVGVDMSRADTTVFAYFCRGFGQVFLANDTLIRSISTWRPAQPDSDGQPRYLFITETDSLEKPGTQRLLLAGPSMIRLAGDGVHPVEYRFAFDPPFALPHRGKFFFDIQADAVGAFPILASTTNPYPDGEGWETGPVWDCSRPAYGRAYRPHPDLVFEIEFCNAGNVGVGHERGVDKFVLLAAPTPASGPVDLTLRLPRAGQYRLDVVDINGRTVYSVVEWFGPGTNHLEVDSSRLPPGLYHVRCVGPGGQVAKAARVVVVR